MEEFKIQSQQINQKNIKLNKSRMQLLRQISVNQDLTQSSNFDAFESNGSASCFQHKFEVIRNFVEELKQPTIQITAKEDQHISEYLTQSFVFLSSERAPENLPLFRNALVSVGHLLSVKFDCFRKEFLSSKFFANLIKYFRKISMENQERNFNTVLYSLFYFIVLIIYKSNREITKILMKGLFTKKFLKILSQLELTEGNKIERYLPILIAFISKNINSNQSTSLMKEIVLKNLHLSRKAVKNHFQFIYCLRMLINQDSFSLKEVRKYEILEILEIFLRNSQEEQVVTMGLQVLKHILRRHQILAYKMVRPCFLDLVEKCYKINPSQSLGLLQIITPCLPYQYKESMLTNSISSYSKQITTDGQSLTQRQLDHLKIMSFLLEELTSRHSLRVLEVVRLETVCSNIVDTSRYSDSQTSQFLSAFLGKMIESVAKVDSNLRYFVCQKLRPFQHHKKIETIFKQNSKIEPIDLE